MLLQRKRCGVAVFGQKFPQKNDENFLIDIVYSMIINLYTENSYFHPTVSQCASACAWCSWFIGRTFKRNLFLKKIRFCLSIPHLASGSRVDLVLVRLHSSVFLLQLFTFPNSHFKWSIFYGRSPHHSFCLLESNASQVIAFSGVMASHCCYFTICIKFTICSCYYHVRCIECADLYWNLWPYQIKSNQVFFLSLSLYLCSLFQFDTSWLMG